MSTENTTATESTESVDPKAIGSTISSREESQSEGTSAASPAGQAAAKPRFDIEKAIKDDLIWSKRRKEEEARLKTERDAFEAEKKQLEPLKDILEPLSKLDRGKVKEALAAFASGDRKAGILAMADLDEDTVLALAEHVAANQGRSEVPVQRQVKDAVQAEMEALKAKEAEERRLAAEKAEADKKAAEEAERSSFTAELDKYCASLATALKGDLGKEFPLCAAFMKRIDADELKAEVERRANSKEPLLFQDVLRKYEDEFQADIDRTPFGRKQPTVTDDYEREEAEFLAKLEPKVEPPKPESQRPIVRTGGTIPTPPEPRERSYAEEEAEEIAKLEQAWRTNRRF